MLTNFNKTGDKLKQKLILSLEKLKCILDSNIYDKFEAFLGKAEY